MGNAIKNMIKNNYKKMSSYFEEDPIDIITFVCLTIILIIVGIVFISGIVYWLKIFRLLD